MAAIRDERVVDGRRVVIQIPSTWERSIRIVQRAELVRVLVAIVRGLKSSLPKRTGRLRRQTTQIVYAVDRRSFRVWSTVYYARFVTTAPPVWQRALQALRRRLRVVRATVELPMVVTVDGESTRRTLDYELRFDRLAPKARTHVLHRLPNEIRGSLSMPLATLRRDVIRQARASLR